MESVHATAEGIKRLALQLQALTEITESLTYRLLGAEEQLAGLAQQLEHAAAAQSSGLDDAAELRLDDTEDRLSRLEAMLASPPTLAGQDARREGLIEEHPFEEQPIEEQPIAHEPAADEPTLFDDQAFLDDVSEQEPMAA